MGHWKCIGCGFSTGWPDFANAHRCGKSGTWEHCTCGSGGHPRKCELHPARFDEHVAELDSEVPGEPLGGGLA